MTYEDPNTPSHLSEDDAKKIISTVDEDNSLLGGHLHPWRRFFSRLVEISITGFSLMFTFTFFFSAIIPKKVEELSEAMENPIIASFVLYTILCPTEAIMLSLFGTTPAKWLFGMRIENQSGKLLSFSKALHRSFRVCVQGVFFSIPFITLIPQLLSYTKVL
jgi:uncharacterized RDD family membrane protein YckC